MKLIFICLAIWIIFAVVFKVFKISFKVLWKILINSLIGAIILFVVNLIPGISVALNVINCFLVGVFGIPAAIIIVIISLL